MTNNDWHSVIHRNILRIDNSVEHTNNSKLSIEKELLNNQNHNTNSDKTQSHDKSVNSTKEFLTEMIKFNDSSNEEKITLDNKSIDLEGNNIAMDIDNILLGKGRMINFHQHQDVLNRNTSANTVEDHIRYQN